MSRRTVVLGLLAWASSAPASARTPPPFSGTAGPRLTDILLRMAAVGPAAQDADMQILVAPRCEKSALLIERMSPRVFERVRFIPCSLVEADDGRVGAVLDGVDRSLALRRFVGEGAPVAVAGDRERLQRRSFDEVGRLLFGATGRTPATPTIVVRDTSFVRIYRGAPGAADFAAIAAWAASLRGDPWASHPALFLD